MRAFRFTSTEDSMDDIRKQVDAACPGLQGRSGFSSETLAGWIYTSSDDSHTTLSLSQGLARGRGQTCSITVELIDAKPYEDIDRCQQEADQKLERAKANPDAWLDQEITVGCQ